jgi:hypothetical protein
MFMRRNRAKNGAPNPTMAQETTTTPEQGSQSVLTPNPTMPSGGQKRTFVPELPSPEETSSRRVKQFLQDDLSGTNYEDQIAEGPLYPGGRTTPPGSTDAKLRRQGR